MRGYFDKRVWFRWWKLLPEVLPSWPSTVAFLVTVTLVGIVWWSIGGQNKAVEQAMENIIPAMVGGVVFLLIIAVVKLGEARQAIRSEAIERRRMKNLQQSRTKIIADWLGNRLADGDLGIIRAYLFGSVTHDDYETNDVDLLLLYNDMSDASYTRKACRLQKRLSSEFEQTFNKGLHFQRFLKREEKGFHDFLAQQSEPILLFNE